MKFKTRLWVTFLTISLVPLLFTALAFMIIGGSLMHGQMLNESGEFSYDNMSESVQAVGQQVQEIYEGLQTDLAENNYIFEDREYLQELSKELADKNGYILVRRNQEIYYTGNEKAAEQIFDKLPSYGTVNGDSSSGYFFSDSQRSGRG